MLGLAAIAETPLAALAEASEAAAPAAPALSTPANASSSTDTTPSFTWVRSVDGFLSHIQIDDDPLFGSPAVDDSTLMNTNYTAAPLAVGTWYWQVRMANGLGTWGDWSVTRSFTITAAPAPSDAERVGGITHALGLGL